MSNEPFLSRWSRLKRETPHKAAPAADPAADAGRTARTEDQAATAPHDAAAEATVDLASLPSLDSIVADTDVSGFLQRGVPAELTKAALRRAWTADPAIRDFIGMAENQWDFTDPNAMFGFGPLRPTDNVAELVAQATGNFKSAVVAEDDLSVAAANPQTTHVEEALPASGKQPTDAGSEKTEPASVSDAGKSGFGDERQPDAAVQNEPRTAERQPFPNRRSGGGALPE